MEPGVALLVLGIRIVGVVYCSNKAGDLNRSKGGWGFFGFMMPILAMIWISFMKPVMVWDKDVDIDK